MIKPGEIPQFTGDLAQLETDYADLKADAGKVRKTGEDVHAQFQGLSAYYTAPEAEQLFATTKPVKDRADTFGDNLETVSGALSSYATEVRPLVAKLKELKAKAVTFVDSVKDDDEWEYDEDKVGEHNRIRDDITATVAAFWAAERTCHNKITGIWGGTQMVAGDGSERNDQYGFDAEDLKNAKLPWGDPVDEKHKWYEVGHWVKSFVWDGLIVDGVWGTIKGLGTLVGFGGWKAMGQAWKGLAQLATGLVLSSMPLVGTAFWLLPDDKLPSWIRDSRTAMKETGKALVAWDEWGKNPGRAAGAVTFNVLTTVFTGGAGAGVSGAGKAGAVAKVLSAAGKAGKFIDPMTYIAKGAGAGLSKIGDITKAIKGVGTIDIPKLPEGAFTLPEGAVKLPDGTVRLPEGTALPEGATRLPDGNVRLPHDTTVLPPGTTKLPSVEGSPAHYMDGDGNLLDQHGNVIDTVDNAPKDVVDRPASGNPASGADVPRVDSPVKEPALVGAGAHTAEQAGQHIRLGDSVGDVGRVGDDVPTAHPDTTPGGTAGHTPGGHAGAHLPSNDLNNPLRHGNGDTPSTGGNHPDTPSSADHPDGTGHADTPSTNGTHTAGPHEPPSTGGAHPGGPDDIGGLGDDAFDRTDEIGGDATTAGHHADEGSTHSSDGRTELSAERLKEIQEEHVWKANNDPEWFKDNYYSDGRRKSAETEVDGALLPILTKDANNSWIPKHDLPNGPSEVRINPAHLGPETAPPENLPKLDESARNRRLSVDLINAEKSFEKTESAANAETLAEAQAAYAEHLDGVPNNSKLSEQLGEASARYHVIPEVFPGAERIELPKTPNGANMFDDVYKLDGDGRYLIVEAKAPSGDLDWRKGKADPDPTNLSAHDGGAQGMRVKQGTKPYLRTILAEMTNRGGRDADIAEKLRAALADGKLQYVLVKATDNPGYSYAGATIEHMKI